MMIMKSGVSMYQVNPRIEILWPVLDRISQKILGRDVIVTGVRDGVHSPTSLHYQGRAVDIRTKDIGNDDKVLAYYDEIRDSLSEHYDVVLEATHIHIEWDPKGDDYV